MSDWNSLESSSPDAGFVIAPGKTVFIRESCYRFGERCLSKIKRRPHHIDRRIPLGLVVSLLLRRCVYAIRGLVKTSLLQFRPKILFLGSRVVLKNARMCYFGKNVTLETGVMIDGLSQRGVVIGDNVSVGSHSIIRGGSMNNIGEGLIIGSDCSCDAWCFFGAGGMITIGDLVIMGQHTSFHAETHLHASTEVPIRTQGIQPQPITIEDDCWIGSNVTFLGGAHVSRGSIVAAGAVVRGAFPPFVVIGGVPAKIIKSRLQVAEQGPVFSDQEGPPNTPSGGVI
jgi:acetyltransferase-like isoleucine patch superfamily enzyme